MSIVLQVRVSEELMDRVVEKAKVEGKTVSNVVRELLSVWAGGSVVKTPIKVYVEPKGGRILRVCGVCGKESENWGYDMGGKVRCSECAVV